jgi:hypothetical protein
MKIVLIFALISVSFLFGCSDGSKKISDERVHSDSDVQELEDGLINDVEVSDLNEVADEIDENITNDLEESGNEDDEEMTDLEEIPDEDNVVWPPAGCLEGEYKVFFGNFHSHTGNSDGKDNPEAAFIMARDEAGLDSLAVTDHLEQLYTLYGMADKDFPDCIKTTASLSNENFLAICGFEYGSGFKVSLETGLNISTGHSNVFFTEKLFPMVQLDFRDYYTTLQNCIECVAQFNHPGDEETQTFNDWEPHPQIFNKMALYEFNGGGDVWNLYFPALANGWYISPTYNQDNHSANWGTANDNRTGLYLTELSQEALKDAFLKRRTYASSDKNATIRMMAGDICWMGSQIQGVNKMKISVEVSDPDGEGFEKIEIFDPFKNIINSKNCGTQPACKLEFELEILTATHIVAKAVQSDGQFLVASPLWFIP